MALSALARHGRQRAAAEALGISRSALSHRIADLEKELGATLVTVQGRVCALTDEGVALLAAMGDALDRIEAACAPFRRERRRIRLSTVDTLASNWLLPRLPDLRRAHPGIALAVLTTRRAVDFAAEDVDCGLRQGLGHWPGLEATPLFRETLVPAAAPDLPGRLPAQWKIIAARSRFRDWPRWWRATGQGGAPPEAPFVVENRAQALEAALAGAGVVLTDARYVAGPVAAGRLVRLGPVLTLEEGIHFVHPPKPRDPRHIRLLRDWLVREAARPPDDFRR